jgi:hypothetical protein
VVGSVVMSLTLNTPICMVCLPLAELFRACNYSTAFICVCIYRHM